MLLCYSLHVAANVQERVAALSDWDFLQLGSFRQLPGLGGWVLIHLFLLSCTIFHKEQGREDSGLRLQEWRLAH